MQSKTKNNRQLLYLIERQKAVFARNDFWEFRLFINKNLKKGWFQYKATKELENFYYDLKAGKKPKLIIEAPPQHGKSSIILDFIAWIAGKEPDYKTIYTSFSERLGIRANLKLQRILASKNYKMTFPKTYLLSGSPYRKMRGTNGFYTENRDLLEYVDHDGFFRNTTVMGSITGESLDLGVIDDPIKGRKDANSEQVRNNTWFWFTDDFFTRFSEDAGFLCILTRWHIDDPIGRFMQIFPESKVLKFPAIAVEEEEFRYPGEPLFPEHKSLNFLLERKKLLDPASWESLYQQNPYLPDGGLIKEHWLMNSYDELPDKFDKIIQSWDTAMKAGELNDFSVCTTWGIKGGKYYLLHVLRERLTYPKLKKTIRVMADHFKPNEILIEDKSSGTSIIQDLGDMEDFSYDIIPVEVDKDKVTRMQFATPAMQSGRTFFPKTANWWETYKTELLQFPDNCVFDDQCDSTSQFLNHMRQQIDNERFFKQNRDIGNMLEGASTDEF